MKRVAEIEAELGELTKMQSNVDKQINAASDSIDENSV
jgi:archaellum component FlaC